MTSNGVGARVAALRPARHLGRLAQQHGERHVDGPPLQQAVLDAQLTVVGGVAHDGERAALTRAQRLELGEALGREREHVALLRLVAPQLERRHAGLVARHGAQVEGRAAVAVVDELGQRVREPARAHVVDRHDRVLVAERPAAIDDLLTAPLHLGVVALHGGEVEVLLRRARGERRGRAAAEADEHRRSAQHDDGRAGRDLALLHVRRAHVAEAAREHDRLVVAAHLAARGAVRLELERAEVAGDVGPAELVVEGGAAQRALDHDVERARDARRLAVVALPRLHGARQAQVRDREAAEPRLGLGAAARGALVADLAARAGRRARERRDRRRVIVRLDLHQDVDRLRVRAVDARRRVGEEAPAHAALDDGGVVLVGREHARGAGLRAAADHLEQRHRLRRAVEDVVGVEDLVPAVLAVRLREHHELDVRGITAEHGVGVDEIVDLVGREREAQFGVGARERRAAVAGQRDVGERPRRRLREEPRRLFGRREHRLGHAIVQRATQRGLVGDDARHGVPDAPLDAPHAAEATDARDVGRLRRPRRDRAEPRHDEQPSRAPAGASFARRARPVGQQPLEHAPLFGRRARRPSRRSARSGRRGR